MKTYPPVFWSPKVLFSALCLTLFAQTSLAQFTKVDAGLTGVGDATVAWADYDLDGDLDFVIAGESAIGNITKLYQNTNGNFKEVGNTPFVGVSLGKAVWADYDNDDDPDLFLTGQEDDGSPVSELYRNTNGTFSLVSTGITPLKAGMAAWRDYDLDGDLDLFVSGADAAGLTQSIVYKNNGGNSFSDAKAGIVGLRRGDGGWMDIDNDGDPDLLLSGRDSNDNRRTIFYQNERGTLTEVLIDLPQVDLGALVWGNFDHLASKHLFLTGFNGNSWLSRLYEYPHATYFKPNDFTEVTADIEAVEFAAADWGDVDNDGEMEIALMGRNPNGFELTLLYGSDPGSDAIVDLKAGFEGLYKGDLAWGDYDNDGALDLLIAGFDAQEQPQTILYRNTSDITVTPPEPPTGLRITRSGDVTTLNWNPGRTSFFYLPFNNVRLGSTPGGSDIISPASQPDGSRLYPSSGNTNFSSKLNIGALSPGTYYWSVQTIDYTLTPSKFSEEHSFTVLANPLFQFTGTSFNSTLAYARWADFDNDGDLDILTDKDLYENQNGSFSAMNSGISYPRLPIDYDSDGDLDVLAYFDQYSALYRNNNGSFEEVPTNFDKRLTYSTFFLFDSDATRTGDFDNDGDEDFIVAVDDGSFDTFGAVYFFENKDGVFSNTGQLWGPVFHIGTPVVGDHDNDGDLDFFIQGVDSYIYKAEGSSLLTNSGSAFNQVNAFYPQSASGTPAWSDIDNDGDLDLIISGAIYGTENPQTFPQYHTLIMRNNGDSDFKEIDAFYPTVYDHTVLADYDNDGDNDLFLSGNEPSMVYKNNNGSFENVVGAFDHVEVRHTALGDYDNDGDMDALVTNMNPDGSFFTGLYKNTSGPKNDAPTTPAGLSSLVEDDAVTLTWNPANDEETDSPGLTYNVRIGSTPGESDIMPAHALADGSRLIPRRGNAEHNTRWPIRNLSAGTYHWSVQAVDAGFAASDFATEQTFVITDGTIPVELTTFDALVENERVLLIWETTSEINNAGFEIERSVNGDAFETLAFIQGHGTSNELHQYQFKDSVLPYAANQLQYRLKQIDFDGQFEHSSSISVIVQAPDAVALTGNYPNPFNPATEIRYALSNDAEISLTIYDINGREVDVLVQGFQNAGRHSVIFDASRLASGVYVYVLQTPTSVEKKQMILLK